jgi:hypothetical protein
MLRNQKTSIREARKIKPLSSFPYIENRLLYKVLGVLGEFGSKPYIMGIIKLINPINPELEGIVFIGGRQDQTPRLLRSLERQRCDSP